MKLTSLLFVFSLFFVSCSEERETKVEKDSPVSKEVVFRVEHSVSGAGGSVGGSKMVLTESGLILKAYKSEKAFFVQEGDTITVQGDKILDIKFKK